MKWQKIKLFIAKYSKVIIPIVCFVFIVLIMLLCIKCNIISRLKTLSDTLIAVIGTLLGAVIGGLFTLLGSIYVNQKQLKAQTHIKKKNLIYKPLYDELCETENILIKNPYPRKINLTNSDYSGFNYPQYTAWQRIKSDTRYLETPNILKTEMNRLFNIMNEYNKQMEQIGKICTDIFNEVLETKVGTTCTISNIGEALYKNILKENNESIDYEYKNSLKDKVEIDEATEQEIGDLFYLKCQENIAFMNLKFTILNWKKQQHKCIDLLKDMITFINVKYEG